MAADLKQKGNEFIRAGKLEEALKCYVDALELAPEDHLIISNKSLVLFKLGRLVSSTLGSPVSNQSLV